MSLHTKRSDALAAGHKTYMTGKPCKHGHTDERLTSNGHCRSCDRMRAKGRVEQKAAYYLANKDRIDTRQRSYKEANPEKVKAAIARWASNNKARRAAQASARRALANQWPVSDIEKLLIQYRYEDAQRLTTETGIEHHVDHIWPLSKGGPHLPWNLQVITATENLQKSNKI